MYTECPLPAQPVVMRLQERDARASARESPFVRGTAFSDGATRLSIVCAISLLLLLFLATFTSSRPGANVNKVLMKNSSNSNDTVIPFGPPMVPGTWTEFGWLTRWMTDDDDAYLFVGWGQVRRLESHRRAQTIGFQIVTHKTGPAGCRADITKDGAVDTKDLLILLSAYSFNVVCPPSTIDLRRSKSVPGGWAVGPLDDADHYEHMTPESRACFADLTHDVSRLRPNLEPGQFAHAS